MKCPHCGKGELVLVARAIAAAFSSAGCTNAGCGMLSILTDSGRVHQLTPAIAMHFPEIFPEPKQETWRDRPPMV